MSDTETSELEAPPVALTEPKRDEPASDVAKDIKPRKGGWFGPVLGGLIAAGVGFGLAQYVPNGWPLQDTAALQTALQAQQAETGALKAQLAELAARPAPQASIDPGLMDRLTALEAKQPADLAPLQQKLAELEQKLKMIEAMPVNGATPSAAALAAQKAAADAVLKQAEETAVQITADAEAAGKAAEARAALSRLQAALDSGAAYASALPSLGEVPAILTENAETGLPTLAALQEAFPPAARSALEAALRANMGESWTDRVTSFLRTQTGARSLAPREGDDPDAILSRAEAALGAGDITTALAEIDGLPTEAKTALAEWQGLAQKRQAGIDAVAGLAATME